MNWEYMPAQDGVYDPQTLPLQSWRAHYLSMGIDRHWEDIKKWHIPQFIEFMEKEIIPHAVDV